jgi:benzoate membrane transport protein
MLQNLKLSHIVAGFVATLVGYSGSVAIIFQAIETVGATPAQASSWMLALGLGMGISGLILSLYFRMPILTAWSTPGAAFLVLALDGVSIEQATGAFLFCGILLFITGVTGWFDRLARWVPDSIANAMLAGVLFRFGVQIFSGMQDNFTLVALMCAAYLLAKRWWPRMAILSVLATGIVVAWAGGMFLPLGDVPVGLSSFEFVMPAFSFQVLLGVGVPLFVVTMTAQNIPGIFVLRANGYTPPASAAIAVTGLTTIILAPFGGFAFNLAAITAAICAGPGAGDDKSHRYLAVVMAGLFYCVIGLFTIAPAAMVGALAGLALLGTIGNSMKAAFDHEDQREAALVTFLVTVSGLAFFGISAPVWALLAGALVLLLNPQRSRLS